MLTGLRCWQRTRFLATVNGFLTIARLYFFGVIIILLNRSRQTPHVWIDDALAADLADKAVKNWFNRYVSSHGICIC